MKIGMIVYSQTGHTLAVATRLQEILAAAGHAVALERLEPSERPRPGATDVPLVNRPAIDGYDSVVLGAPVWGGQLASPMVGYLEGLASLEGAEVVCLMTHAFPPGLGGTMAMRQMNALCTSKGATVRASGDVTWLRFGRKRQIEEVVGRLSRAFGG
jgi:hypothetical protein